MGAPKVTYHAVGRADVRTLERRASETHAEHVATVLDFREEASGGWLSNGARNGDGELGFDVGVWTPVEVLDGGGEGARRGILRGSEDFGLWLGLSGMFRLLQSQGRAGRNGNGVGLVDGVAHLSSGLVIGAVRETEGSARRGRDTDAVGGIKGHREGDRGWWGDIGTRLVGGRVVSG